MSSTNVSLNSQEIAALSALGVRVKTSKKSKTPVVVKPEPVAEVVKTELVAEVVKPELVAEVVKPELVAEVVKPELVALPKTPIAEVRDSLRPFMEGRVFTSRDAKEIASTSGYSARDIKDLFAEMQRELVEAQKKSDEEALVREATLKKSEEEAQLANARQRLESRWMVDNLYKERLAIEPETKQEMDQEREEYVQTHLQKQLGIRVIDYCELVGESECEYVSEPDSDSVSEPDSDSVSEPDSDSVSEFEAHQSEAEADIEEYNFLADTGPEWQTVSAKTPVKKALAPAKKALAPAKKAPAPAKKAPVKVPIEAPVEVPIEAPVAIEDRLANPEFLIEYLMGAYSMGFASAVQTMYLMQLIHHAGPNLSKGITVTTGIVGFTNGGKPIVLSENTSVLRELAKTAWREVNGPRSGLVLRVQRSQLDDGRVVHNMDTTPYIPKERPRILKNDRGGYVMKDGWNIRQIN